MKEIKRFKVNNRKTIYPGWGGAVTVYTGSERRGTEVISGKCQQLFETRDGVVGKFAVNQGGKIVSVLRILS